MPTSTAMPSNVHAPIIGRRQGATSALEGASAEIGRREQDASYDLGGGVIGGRLDSASGDTVGDGVFRQGLEVGHGQAAPDKALELVLRGEGDDRCCC